MKSKDENLTTAESERDAALMKVEALTKQLKENNLEPDLKALEAVAAQNN